MALSKCLQFAAAAVGALFLAFAVMLVRAEYCCDKPRGIDAISQLANREGLDAGNLPPCVDRGIGRAFVADSYAPATGARRLGFLCTGASPVREPRRRVRTDLALGDDRIIFIGSERS
jgi:hypothetical protein